jgi:hypothetical protein
LKTKIDEQHRAGELNESLLSPGQRRHMLEDIGRIGLTLGRALTDGSLAAASFAPETVPVSTANVSDQTATPLERLWLLERL